MATTDPASLPEKATWYLATNPGKDGCGYYYPTGRPAAPGRGSENGFPSEDCATTRRSLRTGRPEYSGFSSRSKSTRCGYAARVNCHQFMLNR